MYEQKLAIDVENRREMFINDQSRRTQKTKTLCTCFH